MKLEAIKNPADLQQIIRGGYVAYTGQLASMTREQFAEIVEQFGGHFSSGVQLGSGITLLVVGERQLPIGKQGYLTSQLRQARIRQRDGASLTIVTERQFLERLGFSAQLDHVSPLVTTTTLCELLNVSRQRISAWVQAGLIRPVTISSGVWHFDFQQVSAAHTLCDLTRSDVTTGRIRRSLEQLARWLPQMDQCLQQLSILEHNGDLVIRLEDGDVAGTDGQLQLDFDRDQEILPPSLPLRIDGAPRTAAQWHDQGLEQESAGYLDDAAESFRQALRMGGPDIHICFDLANVLHQVGYRQQAMERYHQVLEIDPRHVDAWNNLGIVLCELDRPEEGCSAFRRAIQVDQSNARAHYNLADTLDEMGFTQQATVHWQSYLRCDSFSRWADHARNRIADG